MAVEHGRQPAANRRRLWLDPLVAGERRTLGSTGVTFALAYTANQLKVPRTVVLHAITAGAVLSLVTMPLFGYLTDRIGQRRLFSIGLVVMCSYAAPFFATLGTRQTGNVWRAVVLGVGLQFPALYAPESQLFAAQFPTEIRYSGISLTVQIAGVLSGGIAPVIARLGRWQSSLCDRLPDRAWPYRHGLHGPHASPALTVTLR